MGIEYQDLHALIGVLNRDGAPTSGRLLILGDAVIHFDSTSLKKLAELHGFKLSEVPETLEAHSLGKALGFSSVETLDLNGKASISLDLQEPLPEALVGRYNLVIDAGVLFWCFNPGLVLKNVYRFAAPGAVIFHITALTGFYGRGYYNIHPQVLEAFYLANKCEFLQATYRVKPRLRMLGGLIDLLKTKLNHVKRETYGVSKADISGAIYLGKAVRTHIEFQSQFHRPEPDMIPNNVVSTFACRKTKVAEPISPSLVC